METPFPIRPTGPGVRDLMGFLAGYALAGAQVRHMRSGPITSLLPLVGYALCYVWLGLAMSGPILLWFCGRGIPTPPPPSEPRRPERMLGGIAVGGRPDPADLCPASETQRPDFSLNEWLWIVVGGAWLGLTLFRLLVPPDPWPSFERLPSGALMFGLIPWLITALRRRSTARSWTDWMAKFVLLGWPWGTMGFFLVVHAP